MDRQGDGGVGRSTAGGDRLWSAARALSGCFGLQPAVRHGVEHADRPGEGMRRRCAGGGGLFVAISPGRSSERRGFVWRGGDFGEVPAGGGCAKVSTCPKAGYSKYHH